MAGGSQPAIDEVRNQVAVATGNVYEIPAAVQACVNATGNGNETACYPPSVLVEAVVVFDIRTGKINWRQAQHPLMAWTAACGVPGAASKQPTCPPNPGKYWSSKYDADV